MISVRRRPQLCNQATISRAYILIHMLFAGLAFTGPVTLIIVRKYVEAGSAKGL
jgi:hypothetical protein